LFWGFEGLDELASGGEAIGGEVIEGAEDDGVPMGGEGGVAGGRGDGEFAEFLVVNGPDGGGVEGAGGGDHFIDD
jgi:hypothetical protein